MASKVYDESKLPIYNGYPPPKGNPKHPPVYPPPPYQGYAPPFPSYPNLPVKTYPYGTAPPPPPAYHHFQGDPDLRDGYNFARVMLLLMIVLILGMTAISLVTWVLFGSDIPVFRVDSLEMPIFNVTKSTAAAALFSAKWVANVSVTNPNRKLQLFCDNVATTLIYKDSVVDTSSADPFHLGMKEVTTFRSSFETPRSGHAKAAEAVVREMNEERSKGVLSFDLGISLSTAFRLTSTDTGWGKTKTYKILCEDLQVVFPPDSAVAGTLHGGANFKDCLVWV